MRFQPTAQSQIIPDQGNISQQFLQASNAEILERLVAQHFAALAQLNLQGPTPPQFPESPNFQVTHMDIGGGGDGHVFEFRPIAVDFNGVTGNVTAGVEPALIRVFFFMAGDAAALQVASRSIDAKIAALLADAQITSVSLVQTGAAGASQGKRVCQFVAIGITPDPPTIVSAVIGGGNLTITGTEYLSTLPNTQTSVTVAGAGVGTPITLTQAEIIAGGGSVSDTVIVIPTALLTGVAPGDTADVSANAVSSGTTVIT